MQNIFYDGTKILSLMDINGLKPEIYIVTSNRSAGKTTFFNRLLFKRFLKTGGQFMLIFRYNYELGNIADAFFKDIGSLFFPEWQVSGVVKSKGLYVELYAEKNNCTKGTGSKKLCGFAVALNQADNLKRISHLFSGVTSLLFDEFQSETGKYIANEKEKLISLHTSVARGQGQPVRYVPLYMLSNMVSLINPYYEFLGISRRLTKATRFLRGNGYVLEQNFYEKIASKQAESAFNRAFSADSSGYTGFLSQENVYLADSTAFIDKPAGKSIYLLTLKNAGRFYAVREFETGFMYCSDSADLSFPVAIACDFNSHSPSIILMDRHHILVSRLRLYFSRGLFRFKNLECKETILKFLAYK